MAEQPTRVEAVEPEESGQEANLALVVAALGGGPGDRRDSGVRRENTGPSPKGGLADDPGTSR
jgi:hypothetical protein